MPVIPDRAEIPYSHNAPNTGSLCSNGIYDDVNPQAGYATLGGESSSDWDGLTLTSIQIQMCAGNPGQVVSDLIQIGVFTSSTSVQLVFGTFSYNSLPAAGSAPQDWVSVTVTGSYVMQPNDIIGIEFTSSNVNAIV